MISVYDGPALDRAAAACGVDRAALRRLRNLFFKRAAAPGEALAALAPGPRARLAAAVRFEFLRCVERRDSRRDGATKLLFRAGDGVALETVILRIRSGRTSLCVSTQAGCPAGCLFCATGRGGFRRSLTADEILDQVAQAARQLAAEGRAIRNVVFMGMGEPLLNEEAVGAALEVLRSDACFYFSERHLAVSTVGIPGAMERFAERFPGVALAVSLHTARAGLRRRLMPAARAHDLPRLRRALQAVAGRQARPVMIEYLLLEGVNDTPEDADELARFLAGIPARVNLLPFNPVAAAGGLRGAGPEQRRAFARRLRAAGLTVNVRYSLGADIAAACGQLAAAGGAPGA